MSQIEEVIERLCPDGVPYETLRTVAQISGRNIQPSAMGDATVTVYSLPAFDNNRTAERLIGSDVGSAKTALAHPTVLVAKLNPHIPRVWKLASIPNNSYSSPEFFPLVPDPNRLDLGFLYYFISTQLGKLASTVTGSTNSHKRLHREDFLGLRIPVPPLEVQHEIVKILDTFTDLEAELEAELEARRQQYHYCQRLLLSSKVSRSVPLTLGDIGKVSMCKRVFKSQTSEEGEVPFFKIGTFGEQANSFISRELFENYRMNYPFPKKGDVLISAAGTIGKSITYDGAPAYFQDSNIVWIDNNEKIVKNSYLRYWYRTVSWTTDGSIIRRLYNDQIRRTKILIPPIAEQERIVSILDTFDALVNDLNSGLPAELNARRQQYEYYRDKLLTFKELKS
ncbi:restriction endonuclease subunit S [Propionibacterium freudenreichii]|uniref:restriction endonuclease subunit S n=1 Tax=Propionibacterium freudenreichii TaxID=1744 RepID=UPI0021A31237|nr:restriction endonuclease subunit S [Propionibacterium freudenreichii]MCT3014107.1 restriction endonuclease subunit S [Propionibacterium freudenreichii]MDK9610513.1 restriction endonuclease subunit S [Propionibacterium freudenreichii]MDK9621286.1 restriction endonuclease subunit S [Propionibacterium freudenreichii]MDK9624078.1 restriction endonuclease subunit S [Propionibacterium freudenreichii]